MSDERRTARRVLAHRLSRSLEQAVTGAAPSGGGRVRVEAPTTTHGFGLIGPEVRHTFVSASAVAADHTDLLSLITRDGETWGLEFKRGADGDVSSARVELSVDLTELLAAVGLAVIPLALIPDERQPGDGGDAVVEIPF